jgi:hypothetical protein
LQVQIFVTSTLAIERTAGYSNRFDVEIDHRIVANDRRMNFGESSAVKKPTKLPNDLAATKQGIGGCSGLPSVVGQWILSLSLHVRIVAEAVKAFGGCFGGLFNVPETLDAFRYRHTPAALLE